MLQSEQFLIAELEKTLASGSSERRIHMLNRITQLFLTNADTVSSEHVAVFDKFLVRLVDGIETCARAELAERMAPITNAPTSLINKLARDDSIEVAGTVLQNSDCLDDITLIDCSETLGQEHLLAISKRRKLSKSVTNVLAERGDRDVVRCLAGNAGARFSESGFDILVRRASADDLLAEIVGLRHDLPAACFHLLVKQASEVVRSRLSQSHPTRAFAIADIVDEIAEQVDPRRDYTAAEALVASLAKQNALNEETLREFARTGRFEETVAALAAMSDLNCQIVEHAMGSKSADPILIIAKASSLSWPTVQFLLMLDSENRPPSIHRLERQRSSYSNLTLQTAQRVLRFYKVRRAAQSQTWKGSVDA
ncbi:MAG: DUF2336 domain-containing protein [Methylacidiphilales bacterium]|nr:DUF2336 domain-containing protein [Candidatus Methylacidiphilales bacterium]